MDQRLLYIDNAECTWKLFGVIPIASLLSEEEKTITEKADEQTVYSLPFGVDRQDIESQLNVDPQYIKSQDNSTQLVLDIDAMIQVQKIFDKCDYRQKLESGEASSPMTLLLRFFNNGTHYIDSNVCNWVDSLDSVTHNCFKANPMEQNWYDGPVIFTTILIILMYNIANGLYFLRITGTCLCVILTQNIILANAGNSSNVKMELKFLIMLVIGASSFFVLSYSYDDLAFATQCAGHSIQGNFDLADTVFLGNVTSIQYTPFSDTAKISFDVTMSSKEMLEKR